MSFEKLPQNHPEVLNTSIDKRVLEQKEADMRDLFRSSSSPLEIMVAEMQTNEFKNLVSKDVVGKTIEQLQNVSYKNEDDFVTQMMKIAIPVLEITQAGRKDAYKQEGREMYTGADVEAVISAVKESNSEKIYVIGNVGSGKTTFAREISRELDFKNIDVDRWFQIFRQEQQREATDLPELLQYILKKEKPPFVINHADLLQQNLITDADVVVYLNPQKDELLKSRQLREERGAEGGWESVAEHDYNKIERENTELFNGLGGVLKQSSEKSGTLIRVLNTNE